MGCGGVGVVDGGLFGVGLVVSQRHAASLRVGCTSSPRSVFVIGLVGDAALASER